jgi:NADH:ubiquinone oxidoreductase subunit 6 (subunit J)
MDQGVTMSVEQVVFVVLSAITLIGGWIVITNRNLYRAALGMVLSFFGVAGLYALLNVGFLAVVQVLIYVGAISILIIFAIMLTRRVMDRDVVQRNTQWSLSVLVALALFGLLGYMLAFRAADQWTVSSGGLPEKPIEMLGEALVTTYALPFEVASVLLLVALVGAIVIAREK